MHQFHLIGHLSSKKNVKKQIEFLTSPYSIELVDFVDHI